MSAAQPHPFAARPHRTQQQLRRWVTALSDGLVQGFSGPALGLAIQAQMPIHAPIQAPAQPQAPTLKGATA